jgi:hypothetical protein
MFILYYLITEYWPLSKLYNIQLTTYLLENMDTFLYKHPSFIYRSNGYLLREIQVPSTTSRGKRWWCTYVLARGTRGYKIAPSCGHCNQNTVNQLIAPSFQTNTCFYQRRNYCVWAWHYAWFCPASGRFFANVLNGNQSVWTRIKESFFKIMIQFKIAVPRFLTQICLFNEYNLRLCEIL